MIWKRIVIREMERGLVTVNGRLREVLAPAVERAQRSGRATSAQGGDSLVGGPGLEPGTGGI